MPAVETVMTGSDAAPRMPDRVTGALLGLLVVMTPVGVLMMLDPRLAERYLWTTTPYLLLQGAVLFLAIRGIAGTSKTTAAAFLIVTASLVLEYVGVRTGVLFGSYQYSRILEPLIVDVVPPAIGFAWFAVTASTYLLVVSLSKVPRRPALVVFLTASAVLAIDILLEPFAAFVNGFWTWADGEVPLRNYMAWFALGALFAWALVRLVPVEAVRRHRHAAVIAGPVFLLNLIQFTLVNILHDHWTHTIVSLIIIAAVLGVLRTRHAE